MIDLMSMKKLPRKKQRILFLSLLTITVLAPIIFVSSRLKLFASIGRKSFVEDLTITYGTDSLALNLIEQEGGEGLKEPKLVIYKDKHLDSSVSYSSSENNDIGNSGNTGHMSHDKKQYGNGRDTSNNTKDIGNNHERTEEKQKIEQVTESFMNQKRQGQSNQTIERHDHSAGPASRRAIDEKVKGAKDQLIRAKVYLNFAPPGSNSHIVKELKLRIKELERALGEANKDSDLSRTALQKMKSMEFSLAKAGHIFPDCSSMATKIRAMTYNVEEQVKAQKNQANYLLDLVGRTTPKGFHCLSLRLTTEFFAQPSEERQLPNQQRVNDPDLYHYAVFSDNVLASAVVVNSTVSSAKDAEKVVFHVVTDSLNLPTITMWFLLNPPNKATVQILSIDNFKELVSKYHSILEKQNAHDPRYTSALNQLRFYLPDVFPLLNKIVLLDHDAVVQRDLTELWSIDMNGKVNGAVEMCHGDPSYRQKDMYINFSDPSVRDRNDSKECTWAFGMNLFDLQEWRRKNLTTLYHNLLQLGHKRQVFKAGSLPLGWATFYNQTVTLDKRWHRPGLGFESGIGRDEVERAAVIHYDGVRKPWMDIGIGKYKSYWSKHVNFRHPYLQQCNLHE